MEIKLTGLKEVEARLVELGSKVGGKIARAAMLRAAKPIADQAKHNAAMWVDGSGAISHSIGRRFFAGKRAVVSESGEVNLATDGSRMSVQIAPMRKNKTAIALHNLYYKRRIKGIFYGHLLEFGHKLMRRTGETKSYFKRGRLLTKRLTAQVGTVAPKPFLAPALKSRAQEAVSMLAGEMQKGIEKYLKSVNKK